MRKYSIHQKYILLCSISDHLCWLRNAFIPQNQITIKKYILHQYKLSTNTSNKIGHGGIFRYTYFEQFEMMATKLSFTIRKQLPQKPTTIPQRFCRNI